VTAAPIAYDLPVKNLIAGLDATGHVTNTAYRKTSVTFHHNGGRLSHEGVLNVWKTREASAHFDSDGNGDIAQYVGVNMYAWACGNTQGNKESISIEMCNATLAPDYLVADKTWRSAARLGGWLFARVIGAAPTRDTVHVHHDWKSTACAGPYIDKVREQLFQAVLESYNSFVGGGTPSPAPAPTPSGAGLSIDQVARQVIAGSWGNGDDRQRRLRAAGYDPAAVQSEVNRQLSGAPAPASKSVEQLADEVIAGQWGNGSERSRRLQAAGYSPTAVQAAVNAKLGGSGANRPVPLSIGVIADQVIKGQWGNGQERMRRLTAAGYDYNAVRAEVNRRLS
jgi:Cpl-7 lysozyme-like protein/N-acetylmuramoyl-L-alanine amidase-like protein